MSNRGKEQQTDPLNIFMDLRHKGLTQRVQDYWDRGQRSQNRRMTQSEKDGN